MADTNVEIELVPSSHDLPPGGAEYQQELSQISDRLRLSIPPVSSTVELLEASGAETLLLGGFILAARSLIPALPILKEWMHGRFGRKIKAKVGSDEFEASTPEELEKVMALAQEYKKTTEPKRIYEF